MSGGRGRLDRWPVSGRKGQIWWQEGHRFPLPPYLGGPLAEGFGFPEAPGRGVEPVRTPPRRRVAAYQPALHGRATTSSCPESSLLLLQGPLQLGGFPNASELPPPLPGYAAGRTVTL